MAYQFNINHTPTTPEILYSNKWKATDYYIFSTDSELWCQAKLLIIDKQVTDKPEEAVVFLLQRYLLEFEMWTEQMLNDLTPEQFTAMVNLDICDFPDTALYYDIEDFTKSYNEILRGMQGEASLTITKNGSNASTFDFLSEHDVVDVTSLNDAWNNRQYFIETWTGWAFYTWCTGA
ncbi:hypothetical protein [Niastella sp. OAS944]|uniref:hypothetical protein n=1 Tax=Niastella sp. OAS944 TaxID=2664089 RepID=UPI00347BAEF3